MYTRIVNVSLKPGKVDEAIKIYENSVVPAAKAVEGYSGGYLLVDREKNTGKSIAMYETKEKMIASEESGYFQEQLAKFGELFSEPPVTETYENAVNVK